MNGERPARRWCRATASSTWGFYNERIVELQQAFGKASACAYGSSTTSSRPYTTVGEVLRHVGAVPAVPVPLDTRAHNAAHLPRSRVVHRLFPDHARRRAISITYREAR